MSQGLKTGGRQRGTPNKVTAEICEHAQKYTVEALEGSPPRILLCSCSIGLTHSCIASIVGHSLFVDSKLRSRCDNMAALRLTVAPMAPNSAFLHGRENHTTLGFSARPHAEDGFVGSA